MYLASSTAVFIGIASALLTACIFGASDFTIGEVGKKISALASFSSIYLVEIPILLAGMFVVNEFGSTSTNIQMFFVGIFGTFGFACVIYGLANGFASIVMSVSGLLALVVPAIASIVIGESTSWIVWVGVLIAAGAIICITRVSEPEHEEDHKSHSKAVQISLITGICSGLALGIYFVGLDQFDSPIIPKLFYLQLSGFVFGVLYFLKLPRSLVVIKKHFFVFLLLGVAYQIGQLLFPFASERTSLLTTNLIVNLYPAVTIGLAKIVNKERTNKFQHVGFMLALLGVITVSIGAAS